MIRRAIPLLHVTNAAKAFQFYCDGLGFRLEFEHRPEGVTADPCYAGISRDGVWIHFETGWATEFEFSGTATVFNRLICCDSINFVSRRK